MKKVFLIIFLFMVGTLGLSESLFASGIEGKVTDRETGAALPYATVQVIGTSKATSANEDGYFRILCPQGTQILKVSHIGYYSFLDTVSVGDGLAHREISLLSTMLIGQTVVVYDRQFDAAQQIIVEAIKRKKEILERLGDYKYGSYTKFVVRDLSKADTARIMAITETQAQSFWESPNKYKEIITARRQSANMEAADNLVSIGEMLNFNKNRIDIGDYSVVSPVAEDALDYYNYYLLDSTYIDNSKVYKLEAEPKNQADALVAGYVYIADSTYDVVDVDLGFNEGVRLPFVKNLRYRQRVVQFENLYWMPVELRFTADVEIKFPGIPSKMDIELAASIHDYSFETGHAANTFNEYVFEVAETADKVDSATWILRQSIPLTSDEIRGYSVLDSLEKAPKPVGKKLARAGIGAAALLTIGAYDIFRFNRAEGAYAGFSGSIGLPNRGLQLQAKSGYAFSAELYEYRFGTRYQLPGRLKFALKGEVYRDVAQRAVVNQGIYNATFDGLFFKYDPIDYYYRRGGSVGIELSPVSHVRVEGQLDAVRNRSLSSATDFSFFNREDEYRDNPKIQDGDIRVLTGEVSYDSRKLWRNKGRDLRVSEAQYTTISARAAFSSPDFLNSDFDFRKYSVSVHRRQRTLGLGTTSISLFAGASTRTLPAQYYYRLADYSGVLAGEEAAFMTMGDSRFSGDRTGYFYVNHDFGQYLFKKSGLPGIKKIPFTLSVYGGAFWTKFHNGEAFEDGEEVLVAERPYTELGFCVGNLTPFLSVFNFGLYFTWQLSDYDTNKFVTRIGIRF